MPALKNLIIGTLLILLQKCHKYKKKVYAKTNFLIAKRTRFNYRNTIQLNYTIFRQVYSLLILKFTMFCLYIQNRKSYHKQPKILDHSEIKAHNTTFILIKFFGISYECVFRKRSLSALSPKSYFT